MKLPYICITTVHKSQISLRLALRPALSRNRSFWDKCTEWLQNDLENYKSNVPHIWMIYLIESKISLHFAPRPAPFSRYRPLWDNCTKWPPNELDYYKVICTQYMLLVTSIDESYISHRFALRPDLFELQAILRQVHRMTPKWPWTLQGPRYTTYVLLVSQSPKFWSVLLYDQRFPWSCTFYNPPLTSMLNSQKEQNKTKKNDKNPKF